MEDDRTNRIIEALQKQTKTGIRINVIVIVVLAIFMIVSIGYLRHREKSLEVKSDVPIWTKISDAFSKNDRKEELRLVKELLDKNPDDYYLHSYIGTLYVQLRELEKAKKHFEISYRLFPLKDTKNRLTAINQVLSNK